MRFLTSGTELHNRRATSAESGVPSRVLGRRLAPVLIGRSNPRFAETVDRMTQPLDADLHLAAICQSSDYAIIGEDLSGTIASWNQGAERIFGPSEAEAV